MEAILYPQPPPILTGRLEFGNLDQIKALRRYELDVEKAEEPGMSMWVVEVEISDSVTVWARDEEEALEKAQAELDVEPDFIARKIRPRSS